MTSSTTLRAEITPRACSRPLTQTASSRYLLYLPEGYATQPGRAWPLVVFLHGKSPDRDPQVSELTGFFNDLLRKMDFPALLVTPLCPGGDGWRPELVSGLLDELEERYRIDPDHVYLAGMSMGGFGTWETAMRYPERFAAVVSFCGGGDPDRAARMKDLPLWNIHGAKDPIVPLELSEKPALALRAAGGYVIHTVEPDLDHMKLAPWSTDPRPYEWLLAQRRGVRPDPAEIAPREAMRLAGAPVRPAVRSTCPPIEAHTFSRTVTATHDINYLLYLPPEMAKHESPTALPLLVFLHGSGEKGKDLNDLGKLTKYGPMKLLAAGQNLPLIVAAPQCPEEDWGWSPERVAVLVDEVCAHYPVDRDRVYLMGLSMGAVGAWRTLSFFPDRFAAMVAVAGMTHPTDALRVREVPTWTIIGDKDEFFDLESVKKNIATVRNIGADARLTVQPGAHHLDCTKYTEDQHIYDWLLTQKKGFVTPRPPSDPNDQ